MTTRSIVLGLIIAMVASPSLAELENENILAKLPSGFKIDFQQRNANALISEMVPEGQSVNNWTEMVTVQVFYGLKSTPAQFKAKMDDLLKTACPGGELAPVAQGDENGYPTLVWLQNCPLNKSTGKPEITWVKAIQGNDSFYVAQVAFKAQPSKELITQWMQYLKGVAVCDTRLPARACAHAATWDAPSAGTSAQAAANPAAAAAAPSAKLTGRAAWNALVGNSITGDEDGETLVEYYAPNGTAKSRSGKELSTGKWTLRGEQVCFKYPGYDADCYRIEVDGEVATFYESDGSSSQYTMLKGNPKKL